jgi:bifunctional enzyme CysN/CysC
VLARGPVHVGRRFSAEMVWMDERPLDPGRPYLLKHAARIVAAEIDRPLRLNEIERVTISTSLPLVFDRYQDNRTTGSFVVIDPATNFTAGAGMIAHAVREAATGRRHASASERIAQAARAATSEAEAADAVRHILEEVMK